MIHGRQIHLSVCLVFALVLNLAGAGCSGPVAGIDDPIGVKSTEIQVVKAAFNENIASTGGMNKVVLVTIQVISGSQNPMDWDVWLTNQKGEKFTPGIKMGPWPGEQYLEYTWNFGVSEDSSSFTLHLPDDTTIALDSIFGREDQ